ncbi:hypothetical protein Q7P37_004866 [Cladosporium fusiforme]
MMQAAPIRKRRRSSSDADGLRGDIEPADKKARPTLGPSSYSSHSFWHPQDLYTSPSRSYHSQQNKYDSDDQSSMLSEPGSPQALSADEDDDIDMLMSEDSDSPDSPDFSQPPPTGGSPSSSFTNSNPRLPSWKIRTQLQTPNANSNNRIPTPIVPPLHHPAQNQPHPNAHEDEVPTPPSAAEAAGSQLELLSVSDVEMGGAAVPDDPPQITLSLSSHPGAASRQSHFADPPGNGMVRKQRQRSGALSSGCGSPMLDSTAGSADAAEAGINKRGISMGYRPDCEKCRLRVPGHMNHFF